MFHSLHFGVLKSESAYGSNSLMRTAFAITSNTNCRAMANLCAGKGIYSFLKLDGFVIVWRVCYKK